MEKENLIIAYDGDALRNHEIDIEGLAISLTGMSNLLKQANSIINKGFNTKISIKVSSLSPGSFEIHLVTEQLNNILAMFGTNPQIIGLATILNLLGFTGFGLIQFVLKLKNNKVEKIEEVSGDNINVTYIENNEEKQITVNKNVYIFYNDTDVRNSFCKVLNPLTTDGIDSFEIRDAQKNIKEKINKEDLKYFEMSPQNELLDENTIDMWLSFLNISFKDGNKWKFAYGDNEFFASMDDEDFLNGVNNDTMRFAKNDAIKAKVKISQHLTESGIKTSYSIVKILDYKSVTQLRLDLHKKETED